MQFFKNLFGKKEVPEPTVTIEGAGSLDWDADSKYWIGTLSGTTISVAYDGLAKPKEDLAQFVTQTLKQPGFLENTVSRIKSVARAQYPENRHPEIEELQPKDVVFQNPNFILIQFFGPEDHEPFGSAKYMVVKFTLVAIRKHLACHMGRIATGVQAS